MPLRTCCLARERRKTYRVNYPRAFQSEKHEPFNQCTGNKVQGTRASLCVCRRRWGGREMPGGRHGDFLQDGCLEVRSRSRGEREGKSLTITTLFETALLLLGHTVEE
jgi:hypothetical protein